jgi:hypothetical protein
MIGQRYKLFLKFANLGLKIYVVSELMLNFAEH